MFCPTTRRAAGGVLEYNADARDEEPGCLTWLERVWMFLFPGPNGNAYPGAWLLHFHPYAAKPEYLRWERLDQATESGPPTCQRIQQNPFAE